MAATAQARPDEGLASPFTAALRDFVDVTDVGVVGLRREDGSVHQSVAYHVRDDDRLLVSTRSKRFKARAVRRDGWASYCIHGTAKPYPAATFEGPARILTEGIGPATAQLIAKIHGRQTRPVTDDEIAGIDPVILEITPELVYAISYIEP